MACLSLSEQLDQEVYDNHITLVREPLPCMLRALYYKPAGSGGGYIALDTSVKTAGDYNVCLSHELGHFYTLCGDVFHMPQVMRHKCDHHSDVHAVSRLVPLRRLVAAYQHGCRCLEEFAEELEITPAFLAHALHIHATKYGAPVQCAGHVITFDPFDIKPQRR